MLSKVLFWKRKQRVVVPCHFLKVIADARLGLFEVVAGFELTVLVSEFRAVSVLGDLWGELSHMFFELLSLADLDLFVVCEWFSHVLFWVAILRHVLQVRCSQTFKRLWKPDVEGVLQIPGNVLWCVALKVRVRVSGFEQMGLIVLLIEHVLPNFAAKLTHFSYYYNRSPIKNSKKELKCIIY